MRRVFLEGDVADDATCRDFTPADVEDTAPGLIQFAARADRPRRRRRGQLRAFLVREWATVTVQPFRAAAAPYRPADNVGFADHHGTEAGVPPSRSFSSTRAAERRRAPMAGWSKGARQLDREAVDTWSDGLDGVGHRGWTAAAAARDRRRRIDHSPVDAPSAASSGLPGLAVASIHHATALADPRRQGRRRARHGGPVAPSAGHVLGDFAFEQPAANFPGSSLSGDSIHSHDIPCVSPRRLAQGLKLRTMRGRAFAGVFAQTGKVATVGLAFDDIIRPCRFPASARSAMAQRLASGRAVAVPDRHADPPGGVQSSGLFVRGVAGVICLPLRSLRTTSG
ncbi:hypothetical protein ShzoTeo12_53710 (plasmid) [Shinella zoogloeoides]|nr:hypothetical protein ShzoTeo12_53710 [Shinella zoogloeoides]